ncbi:hypothetical protein BDV23DRAFT_163109 [Aspergillus alliaceus]|uniref:Uncharacterized protein n=1 Tax=Petromyces alliaceus TaxID=209559 RepID=A0A5N7BYB3_PETAA|nr:hypothetical protein BDV23DRAFT_163109 [Aspergillus alliaceus]
MDADESQVLFNNRTIVKRKSCMVTELTRCDLPYCRAGLRCLLRRLSIAFLLLILVLRGYCRCPYRDTRFGGILFGTSLLSI